MTKHCQVPHSWALRMPWHRKDWFNVINFFRVWLFEISTVTKWYQAPHSWALRTPWHGKDWFNVINFFVFDYLRSLPWQNSIKHHILEHWGCLDMEKTGLTWLTFSCLIIWPLYRDKILSNTTLVEYRVCLDIENMFLRVLLFYDLDFWRVVSISGTKLVFVY
jgi:hypothetical protein